LIGPKFEINKYNQSIPKSTLSASNIAIKSIYSNSKAPDHPVWHEMMSGSSVILSGIHNRALIKNETETAISILLTREQAEQVSSIKIALNWDDRGH